MLRRKSSLRYHRPTSVKAIATDFDAVIPPVAALLLAASVLTSDLGAAIEQPNSGLCGGSAEIAACLFRSEDPVGGGHFNLEVEDRGSGLVLFRVLMPSALATAERVVPWTNKAVAVLGKTRDGGCLLALVQAATGFVELRYGDANAAEMAGGGRYLSFAQSGARITLDLDDPLLFESGDPAGGQARLLRSGTIEEKWRVLWVVADEARLQQDPRIKGALVAEAGRVADEDRAPVAAGLAGQLARNAELIRRSYRDMVLTRAAFITADERLIPLLVVSDIVATRPSLLAFFGEAAISPIHDALRKPAPAGYPIEYRPGLMQALAEIARGSLAALSPRAEQELIAAARESFSRPSEWRLLREAILLSEPLDDPSLVAAVEELANAPDLQSRGIATPEGAAAIQKAARDVLSRRVTLR